MITENKSRDTWCRPFHESKRENVIAQIRRTRAAIREIYEREKWDAITTQWENEQADFKISMNYWAESLA